MKLKIIQPETNTLEAYLKAAAEAVGCKTEEEITEFLSPSPSIRNTINALPDYIKGKDRLRKAVAHHERILIYGDYDCDGITSLVQMLDLLEAVEHTNPAWFIPDRMADDYGLKQSGVERCIEKYHPQLLITVDCGSNSFNEIRWLKNQGVDCIVIDHHGVVESSDSHPAVAHMNPKAFAQNNPHVMALAEMSTAGLVFLFCEQFCKDNRIGEWDRNRALLLAGLGTLVDVMPLTGVNRALVKHSLGLANNPQDLQRVPGLVALKRICGTGHVRSSTYGFQWGPRLNATGRLEEAKVSVKLLLTKNESEAMPFAEACDKTNTERQKLQAEMVEEAIAQALPKVDNRVLILAQKDWHPGIVGIVASKVKDKFFRPAIVCGWHKEGDFWKGSGRSVEGFDLGDATEDAVNAGVLLRGGGHKMACGLCVDEDKLALLEDFMNSMCTLTNDDFLPRYTVLGDAFNLDSDSWIDIFQRLEPFGNSNPKPRLLIEGARLLWSKEVRKNDGEVWAVKAGFRCDDGPDKLLYLTWTDLQRAESEWQKGADYRMVVSLSRSEKQADDETTVYHNWRIEDCERI
ncbi:MAG: DHH family phosphoesterase [Candidatus Hydrothermarchaeales archaeon]